MSQGDSGTEGCTVGVHILVLLEFRRRTCKAASSFTSREHKVVCVYDFVLRMMLYNKRVVVGIKRLLMGIAHSRRRVVSNKPEPCVHSAGVSLEFRTAVDGWCQRNQSHTCILQLSSHIVHIM